MIRLFQRSLIISKDQAIKCSSVSYNVREFCQQTGEEKINNKISSRKEFEKFKKRKQIEEIFTRDDTKKIQDVELEQATTKVIDVDFISKKLGLDDKSKYLDLHDLVTGSVKSRPGFETYDLTPEETAYGLSELEALLKSKDGERVVTSLINELKQTFGLESDTQMNKKLKELQSEMSLKLGQPIERFIAENKDVSQLTQTQRLIVHKYFENHPFLKNIRQTSFILDLISMSEQYQKSNTSNFEEIFKKHFDIDPESITTTKKDITVNEDPFSAVQDLENVEFVQTADSPFLMNSAKENANVEDKMVQLIKSGTLSMYLQQVIKDARDSLDPASAKLERQLKQERLENELSIQDRILQSKKDQVDLDSRSNQLNEFDGEEEQDIEANDYFDAEVIPELDMVGPIESRQQARDPRDYLKYYHLYPRQIKKWIDYSHTPMGLFTSFGVWYNLPTWYSQHFQPTPPENHVTKKKNENVFKQPELPEDLKNAYRFGVTEDEAALLHPKFKEFLSFRNASQPEVNAYRKQVCIEKYGESLQDSGSSMVQIAILTDRINAANAHLLKNKKDFVSKKRIPELERKRRNLIAYLKRTNVEQFFKITKDLKLKNF